MANWADLSVSSAYATLVQSINDRDIDAAKAFDPAKVTVSNPKTDTVRWSSASRKWEIFNGSAWVDLAQSYAINISGNAATATIAGTANAVPWSGVTGKPTTVSGYGITDMANQSVSYAGSAGLVPSMPQVVRNGQLQSGDAGKWVTITDDTCVIPSAVFQSGHSVRIYNNTGAQRTVTAGSGLVLRTPSGGVGVFTITRFSMVEIFFVAAGYALLNADNAAYTVIS